MCVSTIGSYSTFGKNVKKHGKTQVESWVFGLSHFRLLGLFEEFIEDNISPPRVGDHVPGPQGARRNRYGTYYTVFQEGTIATAT